MASIFNAQQIIDEYGKYYIKEGQNKNRLIRALVQAPETLENHSRHIRTDETKYRMANYTFGNLVKPFKATFEPTSNIQFYPNVIDLHKMKINVQITPDEIEEGWLGFLGGDSTRTKKEWPIVRWLMEEYLAKQIGIDRELNMVYKGKYDADGTTPSDCMDGIKELLVKGADDKYPINVIAGIGELDGSSIFDQIETFDEALPQLYNQQKVVIFMSPSWVRLYKKDKRSQGFYFIDDPKQLDESIMFTKHFICPLPSMEGTNDIWATVPDNLIWMTKREGNLAQASLQQFDYNIHVILDWWEGIGFGCNQMVWTTAETVGQASSTGSHLLFDKIIKLMPSTGSSIKDIIDLLGNIGIHANIETIDDVVKVVFPYPGGINLNCITNKPIIAGTSVVLSAFATGDGLDKIKAMFSPLIDIETYIHGFMLSDSKQYLDNSVNNAHNVENASFRNNEHFGYIGADEFSINNMFMTKTVESGSLEYKYGYCRSVICTPLGDFFGDIETITYPEGFLTTSEAAALEAETPTENPTE